MGLDELKKGLERGKLLPTSEAPTLVITEFSKGYQGNGGGHRLAGPSGTKDLMNVPGGASAILAKILAKKAAAAAEAAKSSQVKSSHAEAAKPGGPKAATLDKANRTGSQPAATAPRAAATPSPKPAAMCSPMAAPTNPTVTPAPRIKAAGTSIAGTSHRTGPACGAPSGKEGAAVKQTSGPTFTDAPLERSDQE